MTEAKPRDGGYVAARLEETLDALDHIARVCRGSRTSTRRIRWIEARAVSAIKGDRAWRELDLPKNEPRAAALGALIVEIFPLAVASLEELRRGETIEVVEMGEEEVKRIPFDAAVACDLKVLEAFVADARRLLPELTQEDPDAAED